METNSQARANIKPANPNQSVEYTSNPFFVSTKGMIKILKVNPGTTMLSGLYFILLIIVIVLLNIFLGSISPLVGGLAAIVLSLTFGTALFGMFYVIAASSIKGEKIGLNQSLAQAFAKLLPLLVIFILSFIAITVGLILLIIPGLYLMGRFALAPVALFEENIGPLEAIKRSFELTKGHVLEILGAFLAGSLLTNGGGLLLPAASTAPLVGRYQELVDLKASGAPKPQIHWWNWALMLIIVFVIGLYVILVATSFNNTKNKNEQINQNLQNYQNYQYDYSQPSLYDQ